MKRRKYGRVLSIILAVCMLLGTLPADLMGGIASVKAASETDSYGITKTVDGDTTTWDFTTVTAAADLVGVTTSGLTGSSELSGSDVGLKSGYMRIFGNRVDSSGTDKPGAGKLAIALDSATTSVEVTIVLTSVGDADATYGSRHLIIGNDTNKLSVYQNKNGADEAQANKFDGDKKWTGTVDSSYFTDGTLVIAGGVGENKIGSISITETKGGSSSDNEPDEPTEPTTNVDTYGITKTTDGVTTTWDFTTVTAAADLVGVTTSGLTGSSELSGSDVGLKSGYMRIFGNRVDSSGTDKPGAGKLAIALDSATTSVEVTIVLTSVGDADATYGSRHLIIGNDTNKLSVYQNKNGADEAQANKFDGDKKWTGTVDSSYFADGTLVIAGGVGENKIGSISIKEIKEEEKETVLVDKTYTYILTDGSVVPKDTTYVGPTTTTDGKVTLSSGIAYHNDHGCMVNAGDSISLKVDGDTTIYLGGCQYSGGTATLTANGETVVAAKALKTEGVCGKNDATNVVAFEYTGGEAELVLTIDSGSNYLPFIKIETKELEEVVEMMETTSVYNLTDGSVVPKDTTYVGPTTTTDGKVTLSSGIAYHNDHGCMVNAGDSISLKAYGDTTIYLGGCQYSGGTATLTANGETVVAAKALKTEGACGKNDATNVVAFEYTGGEADLVLTIDSGSNYLPFIKVVAMVPVPDWVPIEVPVTIASGADVLGDDSVTITNKDDAADTHTVTKDGATLTLRSESTYTVSTENTKIKATVADKETFKTGTEGAAVAIDVESLVVNPTVVCDGLAAGKKLTLTTGSGDSVNTIELTVGSPVELWIGTEYKVACDDTTVEARVNDKTSFKAAADMTELKIDLLSLTNKVTMTVNGNLGTAKVVMTNAADATDKVEFGNGDQVELKLNATYNLSCTNEDLFALIGGKQSYTVATAITALTIDITAAEYHKYDVWDFGAEELTSTKYNIYNNILTEDFVNGLYPGVTPGSTGKNIATFTAGDMTFNDGGYPATHRWRSVNGNITRYDGTAGGTDRQRKDPDGNIYKGYIYSNKNGGTSDVHLAFNAKAGDIFYFLSGSNGGACTYSWATKAGATDAATAEYLATANVEPMTFYATEDATYYLWVSSNEKLAVARAMRETPNKVTVSGRLNVPEGADLTGAALVFTQMAPDGTKLTDIEVPITSNESYSAQLSEQYSYAVSLKGKNGYIVDTSVTADGGEFTLKCSAGNKTVDVTVIKVDLVTVTGSLADLTAEDAAKLTLTFAPFDTTKVYIPEFTVTAGTNNFTAILEKGVRYQLTEDNVGDYTLATASIMASADETQNIVFTKKPVYDIAVTLDGPTAEEAANVALTFSYIGDTATGELDERYVYEFTGVSNVQLRDGQYKVAAVLEGYEQGVTSDLKVNGAATSKTIPMTSTAVVSTEYKEVITVGADKDYATINEALDAVASMNREDGQRVTIEIDPGNYEEMLLVEVDNITLKNASATPSIELKNKGVDIDENAVRITGYYGHGYSYYSMGDDYKWDADVLAANKENGYESVTNPGSGSGTMWNATVDIKASGFQAEGIIFENSFNQYMSKKASEDVIVKQTGAKEGATPRIGMAVGDTTVQKKAYIERAAALAMGNNLSDIVFTNCKFIGRQDTLYGGTSTYAEFNECSIYGECDYIFGGMVAIFNKCDLVFNTDDDQNSVGYITAAQQKSGRGYLMYECTITSTQPGVDTASTRTSKPGFLGRPWQGITSEVVFYNTTIEAADPYWHDATGTKYPSTSLIYETGWLSTLGGESAGMYEYGTVEESGVDNSAKRASWASVPVDNKMNDGVYITFDAFRKQSAEGLYNIDLSKGLKEGVEYDGGISVMDDMPLKADGFVQGAANPSGDNKGGIPSDGAVLILNAQDDGRLKLNIKSASGKTFYVVDSNGTCVEDFKVEQTMTKVIAVEKGETYYVYANGSKICLYSIVVDYRPSVDWSTVDAPVLGTPVVSQIGDATEGKVTIPYTAAIGGVYSDSMDIKIYKDGVLVDTVNIVDETDPLKGFESEYTVELPESGDYTFTAELKRLGEKAKTSNTVAANGFVLPMARPVIVNVESQGNGVAKFSWKEVAEAESYNVYLDGEKVASTADVFYRFTGLAAGTYEFKVEAVGNGDTSVASYLKAEVTAEAKKTWLFAAFGDGVDTKNNKFEGSVDENNLVVYGAGGKGKIVPASTDGLAFYYTTIDPETENFTLTADVTVKEWKYSNGQEGFGMMAADAVGAHGDSTTFWNNSYMLSATKIEYKWDPELQMVADEGVKYSMRLGIGAQEKIGVTPENLEDIKSGIALDQFVSRMAPLETAAPLSQGNELLAGNYNRVANYTNDGGLEGITDVNPQSTFKMTIQRNNTGYILSYTDENGVTTSKTYYHDPEGGDALAKLDPNNIYVGFFASRNAVISVKNVELTTINPADDAPAEERPIEYVPVTATFESTNFSTTASYELVYYGNADGTLTIINGSNIIARDMEVKADTKYRFNVGLTDKGNLFDGNFTPDPNYVPSKYERLDNYGSTSFSMEVDYTPSERNIYYVSPDGWPSGDGSKKYPMDLYTAVKSVDAGDYILLMEGTYEYTQTVTIQRGIDGTADNMIYLIADPEATSRPVIDFNKGAAGIVLAGDYWYFQGFDVTGSAPGQKGIQVSGDNNILDSLYTYRNGNTGIQISRFKGTDTWEDWPSNNLVLNCTSYLNADPGYEDADGFAAKLTVADGNVFDGCIAAYNADDGWDLFAKIETGPIGVVTIKNSIAFKNGFDIAADGSEIIAGNGNGFKMGGGSITGAHVLENSIAFANRAKGIDSNSGPNIKVYNSTSFDNASYNVAFYTNTAKNTDYYAEGIISYNKNNTEADSIKLRGTQDDSQVYGESNYYEKGTKSTNTKKVQVEDSWFVSLDTDAAINGGITRNADGTINMNGYLELTDAAPANAGATLDETTGTASAVIVVDPDKIAEDEADDEDDDDEESSDESTEEGSDSTDGSASEGTTSGSGSTGNAGSSTGSSEGGKTEGGKTEDGKTEGGKTEDGKTEGGKTEDGKTEGGKTEDGKTEGGKTEDGKTEGGKTEDGKTESDKKEDGKTESSSEGNNAGASAPADSDEVEGGSNALPIILGVLGAVAVAGIIFLIILKRKDKEDEE